MFIDPPGTGYSRVTAKEDEIRRHFYSVDGDIDTLAVVMRRWLETHGRLQSPKFIVGESYGGFRGPKLARTLLDRQGVGISGLVLISPVLDFDGRDAPWNPLRYVNTLPSMAAAYRNATSRADLQDVEEYATGGYLADLLRGEGDTAAIERLTARVSALIGLDPALVRRRAGRIGLSTFLRDRQPGFVDSPYDATVAAADPFPAAANDNSPDPLLDGMRGPLTSGDAVCVSHMARLAAGGRAGPAIRGAERASRRVSGITEGEWYGPRSTAISGSSSLSTRQPGWLSRMG